MRRIKKAIVSWWDGMENRDGFLKNIEVVFGEWEDWKDRMADTNRRMKTGSWRLGKTWYLHIAINYIEETNDALPRTYTYIQLLVLLGGLIWLVARAIA